MEQKAKNKLSRVIIALLLANIFLLIVIIFSAQPDLRNQIFTRIIPSELTELTNSSRKQANLEELKENPLLTIAAQLKANDMAKNGYFAHTSPDHKTPWFWLKLAGYNYLYAGENLAVKFTKSESVSNAWMNSQTHRNNILGKQFTEIGIATAEGTYKGKKVTFVVQMFGTPMPKFGTAFLRTNPDKSKISTIAEINDDSKNRELYLEYQSGAPASLNAALKFIDNWF